MQSFWSGKRVTVTGGAGFLGQHLVRRLKNYGAEVFVPRQRDYNLTSLDSCLRCLLEQPCDMLFHTAAYYGGIGINVNEPAKLYYSNLVMGANVMEAARLAKVGKVVNIGTACSYPGYLEGELKEEDLWNGPCHASVVNYGLTKKMLAVQGVAYKKQYGLDSIHLILTNLYGPGDSYNPDRSHVVAALVRKFVEADLAGAKEVEVWGTGKPIREFIYVEDCADAIVLAAEKYQDVTPAPEHRHGCGHVDSRAGRGRSQGVRLQGQDRLERRQARRRGQEGARRDAACSGRSTAGCRPRRWSQAWPRRFAGTATTRPRPTPSGKRSMAADDCCRT